ncbi:MAG: hypothetical protein GC137_08835 [Alphaproteobacteria bacterium]|nr:hypothetical protein [Alphaproteobacteria bacterium]
MTDSHFDHMIDARKIENESAHPTHKVGAVLIRDNFKIARANFWPEILHEHIGADKKLGNASTTVHAEIAALLDTCVTEAADFYVTDLPCPNCAKMLSEARVSNIYIDHATHQTPLGKKMRPFFEKVSIPILKAAAINVYEVNIEDMTITPLVEGDDAALLSVQHPVHKLEISNHDISQKRFFTLISDYEEIKNLDLPYASTIAKDKNGQHHFLFAYPQRSVGLSEMEADRLRNMQNKYKPSIQPLNRLLLSCARFGLKIEPKYLFTSQVPTSREFVNMIGAGYLSITIGDETKCRDQWGLRALAQLKKINCFKLN